MSSSTLLGEQMVAKGVQERKPPWEKVGVALTTLNDCGGKQGDVESETSKGMQLPQGSVIVATGRDPAD